MQIAKDNATWNLFGLFFNLNMAPKCSSVWFFVASLYTEWWSHGTQSCLRFLVMAATQDGYWNGWQHMSHFSYSCKMWCPLNLVLENWEYLWFYWAFWIVVLDCGLKLHKLLIHTLVMLQKWIEINLNHCLKFPLCCISCHIWYGKFSEKNVSTVIKDKLLVSKALNSCFKGLDFFQMLLASHR